MLIFDYLLFSTRTSKDVGEYSPQTYRVGTELFGARSTLPVPETHKNGASSIDGALLTHPDYSSGQRASRRLGGENIASVPSAFLCTSNPERGYGWVSEWYRYSYRY